MTFPTLTFPLTVDFGNAGYWIGETGPYQYGAAVTAFFIGDDLADGVGDPLLLVRELERQLRAFGGHLQPYVRKELVDADLFLQPERATTDGSVCFAFHPIEGDVGTMVKRYVFSSLRDFLYVELGKAIAHGNAVYVDGGSSMSRGTGRCTVSALHLARKARPAGKQGLEPCLRKRSKRKMPESSTSGRRRNTTPGE